MENIQKYRIKDQPTQIYATKTNHQRPHAAYHATHESKYEHEYG